MEVAVINTVSDDLVMALAHLQQTPAVFIFDIDHDRARRLDSQPGEKNHLRLEVVLHSAVIIEMIARQIGKDLNLEGDSKRALLLKRVRGNFHNGFTTATLYGAGEKLVQLKRFGCRVRSRVDLVSDAVLDRANHSDFSTGSAQHAAKNE